MQSYFRYVLIAAIGCVLSADLLVVDFGHRAVSSSAAASPAISSPVSSTPTPGCEDSDEPDGDGDACDFDTPTTSDDGASGADDSMPGDQPACGRGGCTTWGYAPMTVSLTLHDRPITYRPPKGPSVNIDIDYSHRDVVPPIVDSQPTIVNYSNLGPQWTHSWLSFVDDKVATSTAAVLYQRGGGTETYSYGSTTGQSATGTYSQAQLVRNINGSGQTVGFTRTLKDGTVEQFAQAGSLAAPCNIPPPLLVTNCRLLATVAASRFYLSAVVDPHGNKVSLAYDNYNRLVTIADAIGQVTKFDYGLTSDILKITKITDPFGRSVLSLRTRMGWATLSML